MSSLVSHTNRQAEADPHSGSKAFLWLFSKSYHLRLREPSCVICRQSAEWFEYGGSTRNPQIVAAVIGHGSSKLPIAVFPFKYPIVGHNLASAIVYINGEEKRWVLCRDIDCQTCLACPEAFVFHMECFRLVKKIAGERTTSQGPQDEHGTQRDVLRRIWLAGYYSRPSKELYYEVSPPPFNTPLGPLAKMEILDNEYATLLNRISQLPQELSQTIVDYSSDSPLWRYALALAWCSGPLGNIKGGKLITLSPNNLCKWRRGGGLQTCLHQHKYVRLTCDDNGIEAVESLDCRTVVPQSSYKYPDKWYIFEDLAQLEHFPIQSNGELVRIKPQTSQNKCIMWDTPSPPSWNSCKFFVDNVKRLQRIRTISLDEHLTGITVFSNGDLTYGVHGHRGRSSAMDAYSKVPKFHQEKVMWLYFPFGDGEYVEDMWSRHRKIFKRKGGNQPVIHTSHGRTYAFGLHVDAEDSRRLSKFEYDHLSSRPSCLLFDDPNPGRPIWSFGTSSFITPSVEHSLPPLRKAIPRPTDHRVPPDLQFCSYASLEDVDNVRCFYQFCNITNGQIVQGCIGVLLEYSNKRRAALGECRIGACDNTLVEAPTAMYVKTFGYGHENCVVQVQFTSSVQSEELDRPSWERKEMVGEIIWWFEHGKVIIIYSQDNYQSLEAPSETEDYF